MQEHKLDENQLSANKETEAKDAEIVEEAHVNEKDRLTAELREINDKYLRLYAEFENYKKRVSKEKEEILKYGNETLLYELLSVIDNLEMALKHSSNGSVEGVVEGVKITLRELQRTFERFGVTPIEAIGKPFDPSVHEAMELIERDDVEEKTVIEEFRKGYMFKDRLLRPSLVVVSKKRVNNKDQEE